MADVSVSSQSQQAKRKRGRPRKDNNLNRDGVGLQSPENSSLMKTQPLDKINPNNGTCVDTSSSSSMVGSVVHCVIEGSFDAGYLISVTIGNDHTPLRGVVFLPKKIVPISATNDVAPQAKMYDRSAIPLPVPVPDNLNQTSDMNVPERASKQPLLRPPLPASSAKTTMPDDDACKHLSNVNPNGPSLRMVEEDEVMQAFEVSTSSGSNLQLHHNLMDKNMPQSTTFEMNIGHDIEQPRPFLHNSPTIELLKTDVQQPVYYNQSFQQNLFTEPKSLSDTQYDPGETSQNLKLGLETVAAGSERSYGYHQALVAGNPLLLPPDLMMEKATSPMETNSEHESREAVGSYKLEVDTPTLHTRPTPETNYCIGEMDFVLNDAVRPAESQHHQTDQASETTHA